MLSTVPYITCPEGLWASRRAPHGTERSQGALCVLPYRPNGSAATILRTLSIQDRGFGRA
jgi:hypothetical protein